MLQIEGLLAAGIWALLGVIVLVSFSPEDKRDAALMLLVSGATFAATLFSQLPSVARGLQLLLGAQVLLVLAWIVRHKLLPRSRRGR